MARVVFFLILLTLAVDLQAAESFQVTINDCWKNNNHIQMSQCVEFLKKKSADDLAEMEQKLIKAIDEDDEEVQYLKTMKKTLRESVQSFRSYRSRQCNFAASLAAGGNATHDLRAACEFELNTQRIEQLRAMGKRWF